MPPAPPQSVWQDVQLFDDRPKGQENVSPDAASRVAPDRLSPIIDVLCHHIGTALQAKPGNPERQLRLGLFGGLGQGKTSAIRQAVARICQEMQIPRRRWQQRQRAPRCTFFDAAAYKPDLLEFEFDRLIGRWYLGLHLERFLLLLLGGVLLLALCYAPLAYLISWLSGRTFWRVYQFTLPGLLATIPLGMLLLFLCRLMTNWAVVHHLFRDVEQQFNLPSSPWRHLRQYASLVLLPPDMLVMDNLDRANVQQQRALLRAVRKHSDALWLPIIVVMDETELLRAKPYDAEAPEELLRKAIQVECRMPIRLGDDAAFLVTALTTELAGKNGHNAVGCLLRDARLRGDWTRVFVLLGGLGPRRMKRFLNDVLSACVELNVPHPDDVAALTRLYALFALAPELRSSGERVVLTLAANDTAAFAALCSPLTPELTQQLMAFLQATRHMQPQDSNWRRLVTKITRYSAAAAVASAPTGGAERESPVPQMTLGTSERLSGYLRAVGKGYAGDFVREEDSTPEAHAGDASIPVPPQASTPSETLLHQWAVVEAALCAAETPAERWRILIRWQRDIAARESATDPAHAARFLLWRVWLGDEAVLALMLQEDREALFQRVAATPYRALFLLIPGQYLHWIDRVVLASSPDVFGQRDIQSIGPWLAAGAREVGPQQPTQLLPVAVQAITGLVNLAWPPFAHETTAATDPAWQAELRWHFLALQQLHHAGIPIRPNALQTALFERGWLNTQAAYVPELLALLSHLLLWPITPGPNLQAVLPGGRFHILDAVLLEDAEAVTTFRTALTACTPHHFRAPQTWWTGLLIGLYYQDPQICRAWMRTLSQTTHACHDGRLLEYLLRDSVSLLWDEQVVGTKAILQLFGSALNAFTDVGQGEEPRAVSLAHTLHDRLRGRTDYGCIVSALHRTPTVPPLCLRRPCGVSQC